MTSAKKKCEMNEPYISVVIPLYNGEKYIAACLDSILGQKFTNFEIIVVNDGSVDSSEEICLKYAEKDPRVRYYFKENGGAFSSRIYGGSLARGTFVTYCDCDDYYINNRAFDIMVENAIDEPGFVLQFGYTKVFNHLKQNKRFTDKTIKVTGHEFLKNEYPKLVCSFWDGSHVTTNTVNKLYHKTIMKHVSEIPADRKIFWGDDQIINLHLLEKCRSFKVIPDILYCYRQFCGGTAKFSLNTMNDLNEIKENQLYFYNKYEWPEKDKMLYKIHYELADWFFFQVQLGVEALCEKELAAHINDSLSLSNFELCREYFLKNEDDRSLVVNLLRKGDTAAYIAEAKKSVYNRSLKSKFISLLKNIYSRI